MKYRVKKVFLESEEMVTTVKGGKVVALVKAQQRTTPASENGPSKTVSIPMATQEEMGQMFKDGNPVIEQYEDSATEKK